MGKPKNEFYFFRSFFLRIANGIASKAAVIAIIHLAATARWYIPNSLPIDGFLISSINSYFHKYHNPTSIFKPIFKI
jgi:hypothetical protein